MSKKFDGIIFDMDGVIRIGNKPISGANNIIKYMNSNNIGGMLMTNECRYTEDELRNDLLELGINIPQHWYIYSASMAVRDYLEKKIVKNNDKNYSIGIIGEIGLFETINQLSKYSNFEIVETPPKYKTNLILIIGSVNRIKISTLEKGLKWLKSDAKIITTCPDTSDPSSKGDFNLGMPNHILHLLQYNTKIFKPYSLGKPNPIFVNKIKSVFSDISTNNLLFVGDTIYTDIRMAEENNIPSCLVLSGNSSKETLKNNIIEPDYIIDSIKNLTDIL